MNEEKIVKINDIKISDTGFKNLQFETSRYSDGLNTIRGFGDMLNEQNLSVIDTVSIDFVLNYYEFRELAYIYCLFKANGILPVENEYLLNKIKSTYEEGKSEEEIRDSVFKDGDITHLICFLNRMSITSLERTNNGYQVNMVLTLYDNVFTSDEFLSYKKSYEEWLEKTNFETLCYEAIDDFIDKLSEYSNLDLNIYNVEKLNIVYKEHVLNTSAVNQKLNLNTKEENIKKEEKRLQKTQEKILEGKQNAYEAKKAELETLSSKKNLTESELKQIEEDKQQLEYIKTNLHSVDISDIGTKISIPNSSIIQIEFITNNLISNVPIKGSPIGCKSYLGIGSTNFSVKLLFNEFENSNENGNNDVVEQLKRLSDKNLTNHKIEINHPLIQLFDFHTSNIVNMTFNNLEEANGIMVNIVFSLNGFRFSEETTVNTDEMVDSLEYDNDYKQEEIGGLYLEFIANYIFSRRKSLTWANLNGLYGTILESLIINNSGKNDTYNSDLFSHDYHFLDFLASYSSLPTCFGVHSFSSNDMETPVSTFTFYRDIEKELLNNFFNKKITDDYKHYGGIQSILLAEGNIFTDTKQYLLKDGALDCFRSLFNGGHYYAYVDNISSISLLANDKYKDFISRFLSSDLFKEVEYKYLINEIIKPITVELFNTKVNNDLDIYSNEVFKKLYDEFYFRLFYLLNVTCKQLIEEIKVTSFISSTQDNILFSEIRKYIGKISEKLFEAFDQTFYDGPFIERIVEQVIDENLNNIDKLEAKENISDRIDKAKKNVKLFTLEFERQYEVNKEVIINRAYNIFLSKLNYFLAMYCNNNNISYTGGISYPFGSKYEEKFNFSIDDLIKIYLISSGVHSLLLNRTSTRTDHFENNIVINTKNIGYKISTYNTHLKPMEIEDDNKEIKKINLLFYQTFNPDLLKKMEGFDNIEASKQGNPFSFYKERINYDDFLYNDKNLFDKNPNKDINFFYGNKLKQSTLYYDMYEILHNNSKKETTDFYSLLNQSKDEFITGNISESGDESIVKTLDLSKNELTNINSIDFPYMNFGFIPSHFTELFYENKKERFNTRMKQRIIGNIDPFKNLLELSKIVYESENNIVPDYDVCIYKKEYRENVGETFKIINNKKYIFLKNVASISIVKNPKDKIKTMTISFNNISKSIFNFDPINGSFDIKALENGKVDIIHIEPGDEIRVRMGYDRKVQLFNGFINNIANAGNQLVINCSSFASLLYNEKIPQMNLRPEPSWINQASKVVKNLTNQIKTTLEKVASEKIEAIRSMHNVKNPLNDHIFKSHDGKILYNKVFEDGERATMYSAFNLILSNLSSYVSEKFVKSKISEITKSQMATETYVKKSLYGMFGSNKLGYQNTNKTYDIYTNINNVDVDYETYGIRKEESNKYGSNDFNPFNPFSVNYYKYNPETSISDSKKQEVEEQTDDKKETVFDPNKNKPQYNFATDPTNPLDKQEDVIYKNDQEFIKNNIDSPVSGPSEGIEIIVPDIHFSENKDQESDDENKESNDFFEVEDDKQENIITRDDVQITINPIEITDEERGSIIKDVINHHNNLLLKLNPEIKKDNKVEIFNVIKSYNDKLINQLNEKMKKEHRKINIKNIINSSKNDLKISLSDKIIKDNKAKIFQILESHQNNLIQLLNEQIKSITTKPTVTTKPTSSKPNKAPNVTDAIIKDEVNKEEDKEFISKEEILGNADKIQTPDEALSDSKIIKVDNDFISKLSKKGNKVDNLKNYSISVKKYKSISEEIALSSNSISVSEGYYARKHEAFSSTKYNDDEGIPTIGYGFNLKNGPFTDEQKSEWSKDGYKMDKNYANEIFTKIFSEFKTKLIKNNKEFYNAILYEDGTEDKVRLGALVDMCYNGGSNMLAKFKNLKKFLINKDYVSASYEILNSNYAKNQKGNYRERAIEISLFIRYGDLSAHPENFVNPNFVENKKDTNSDENIESKDTAIIEGTSQATDGSNTIVDDKISKKINNTEDGILCGSMCLPTDPEANRISSLYKEYRSNNRVHYGIDICRPYNDVKHNTTLYKNIYAVTDGVVEAIFIDGKYATEKDKNGKIIYKYKRDSKGRPLLDKKGRKQYEPPKSGGLTIKLKHKFNYGEKGRKKGQYKDFFTLYMHLSEVKVKIGDKVTKGQVIGIIGNSSGYAMGEENKTYKDINNAKLCTSVFEEHLHFEIRVGYSTSSYERKTKKGNATQKTKRLNPFDKETLPYHNWDVLWNQVNIKAHNGQYTESWKDSYKNAAKVLATKNIENAIKPTTKFADTNYNVKGEMV